MTTAELTHTDHIAQLSECAERVRTTAPGTVSEDVAITRLAKAIRRSVEAGVSNEDRLRALKTDGIVREGALAGVSA